MSVEKNDRMFLYRCILELETAEECERFFEDLCTYQEIDAICQRLQAARLLKDGKTYKEVAEATGASTVTISRVNRSLNHGSGGYEIIFRKIKEKLRDE